MAAAPLHHLAPLLSLAPAWAASLQQPAATLDRQRQQDPYQPIQQLLRRHDRVAFHQPTAPDRPGIARLVQHQQSGRRQPG